MGKNFDIEAVKKTLLESSTEKWTATKLLDLGAALQHLDDDDPGTYLNKERIGFMTVTTRYTLGYHYPRNAWHSVQVVLEEQHYNTLSTLCDIHKLLRPKVT